MVGGRVAKGPCGKGFRVRIRCGSRNERTVVEGGDYAEREVERGDKVGVERVKRGNQVHLSLTPGRNGVL